MNTLELYDNNFNLFGRVLPQASQIIKDEGSFQKLYPAKNEFYRSNLETVILKPEKQSVLYLKSATDSEIVAFALNETVNIKPNVWFYVETDGGINLKSGAKLSESSFTKKTFSIYLNTSNFSHSSTTIVNMENTVSEAEKIVEEKLLDIDLNVNYIAKQLNVSTSYLYRCAVRKYGIGMSQYICEKKLLIAEKLLVDGKLSSTEIANRLNFCSQSYFSLQFKKKFGVTPLAYRKQHLL